MNNEIKKVLSFSVSFLFIALLGFMPMGQKMVFSLDWGNLGIKMMEAGVIDKDKFENLYEKRGGLTESEKKLLYDINNENYVITSQNSQMALNMLWAFGLGNKNSILENGPMMDERYGGAGNFASTGGWTLSKGSSMNHYNIHSFVTLSQEEQTLVERVARNIYRPCCNNSTYFPDCNHGMAMLGLLELMASQGASEGEMYENALQVNTLWFPEQYKTIATYATNNGMTLSAKEILSIDYSSASGYQKVLASMEPREQKSGGSCGV